MMHNAFFLLFAMHRDVNWIAAQGYFNSLRVIIQSQPKTDDICLGEYLDLI